MFAVGSPAAKDEETALHCAAARGHMECVQTLLDGGSPVDELDSEVKFNLRKRSRHHRTALVCALENGHLDIALLLIHKGCKINEPDEKGNTPLHVAARLGLLTAVQTLCHCGADVDMTNQNSITGISQKIVELEWNMVILNQQTPLILWRKCREKYHAAGNRTDSFTPLHLAAKEGFLDIVRVLCLARSNVGKKTKDGLTAEILALASEHTHVASLLSKMKMDNVREAYIDQLCPMNAPLRRIKLKLFGHSQTGKSRLIQSLHSTRDAVSRRISDHYSPSNTMNKGVECDHIAKSLDCLVLPVAPWKRGRGLLSGKP
ncbi:ankyrin repeat protein [Ancylostoma duodenale]|uniref:Ankyrin repeat protein n=1 Tax=Ancylostoma duodenale TaxID=51022 RepID=A0A0C2H0X1_9BILA|nr:ankyrin repeat protein [Ancylostoma duodenale]